MRCKSLVARRALPRTETTTRTEMKARKCRLLEPAHRQSMAGANIEGNFAVQWVVGTTSLFCVRRRWTRHLCLAVTWTTSAGIP